MYKLPPLPYELNALEPFIKAETMDLHFNKHHRGYTEKLNQIILSHDPTLFECMNETTIAMYINTFPIEIRQNLKNQLGGHINHSFFWPLMSTKDTTQFKNKMEPLFKEQFGSIDQALSEFTTHATTHFGSGWTWICYNPISENLEIRNYHNQDTPLFDNLYPLLGIDLWEHAYYLQYKNDKKLYIEEWIKIINWEYVFELWHSYHENHESKNQCTEKNKEAHPEGCC